MIEYKIYATTDATEELVGTYGYFGDSITSVRDKLRDGTDGNSLLMLAKIHNEDAPCRFQPNKCAPYALYMPVCTSENKEAYLAWRAGKHLQQGNTTWIPGMGVEPDFLTEETFNIESEQPKKRYAPFDTIDDFIDASGVTNKNCA